MGLEGQVRGTVTLSQVDRVTVPLTEQGIVRPLRVLLRHAHAPDWLVGIMKPTLANGKSCALRCGYTQAVKAGSVFFVRFRIHPVSVIPAQLKLHIVVLLDNR